MRSSRSTAKRSVVRRVDPIQDPEGGHLSPGHDLPAHPQEGRPPREIEVAQEQVRVPFQVVDLVPVVEKVVIPRGVILEHVRPHVPCAVVEEPELQEIVEGHPGSDSPHIVPPLDEQEIPLGNEIAGLDRNRVVIRRIDRPEGGLQLEPPEEAPFSVLLVCQDRPATVRVHQDQEQRATQQPRVPPRVPSHAESSSTAFVADPDARRSVNAGTNKTDPTAARNTVTPRARAIWLANLRPMKNQGNMAARNSPPRKKTVPGSPLNAGRTSDVRGSDPWGGTLHLTNQPIAEDRTEPDCHG